MYSEVRPDSQAELAKISYTLSSSPSECTRVLVASADFDVLFQLSVILEDVVQLVACSSAKELEVVLKCQNLAMVIFDLQSYGKQGFILEPRLEQYFTSRNIPILLVTGNADAEREAKILEDGFGDVIVYPFIPSVVRARVKLQIALKQNKSFRERRLMNLYRALSSINEAIMRLRGERELFQVFCDIAVEYGEMELAWVGIPDSDGKLVHVASKGRAIGYLDNLLVSTNPDVPEGRGLSGIAFREIRPAVTNDISSDALMLPWVRRNQEYGISSIAAYPISRGGNPYAVLAVYNCQIGAFDDEIVHLLGKIASNISFALDNLDREAARLASENRFRVIAEESPFPMMIHAEDGQIIMVNRAWTDITGYSVEEIPTISTWTNITYGENRSTVQLSIERLCGISERIDEGEYVIRCKDGSTRVWHFSSSPIGKLADGRRAVVSMAMDVTERKEAEKEMKLAATVFRDSSEAMMITDSMNNIITVNPAFCELTGYAHEEVIGKNPSMLKSDLHDRPFYEDMWNQIYSTHHWQGDIWNRNKNGELYAARLVINAVNEPGKQPSRYVGLLADITEKKQSEEMLWLQANYDALTGLPNRNLFRSHLSQAIRHCSRANTKLALMFLDLDGFKKVNDSLGHNMGDLLLKKVAHRLENCIRESDIATRLGGDEFTVILTELNHPRNVERIAQNILRTLAEPYKLVDDIAHVSASIGIAFFPNDGLDIEDLIRNADQAMYVAKQAGKNRYYYCNT